MPSTPPNSNSLLHQLNPYSSMARSSRAGEGDGSAARDPGDSPSTMLLRELAGESDGEGESRSAPAGRRGNADAGEGQDEEAQEDDETEEYRRERFSPTPTPTGRHVPRHVSEGEDNGGGDDEEDEEGPPASIMYGDQSPRQPTHPSEASRASQPSASRTSTVNVATGLGGGTGGRSSMERIRKLSPPMSSPSNIGGVDTPRTGTPRASNFVNSDGSHAKQRGTGQGSGNGSGSGIFRARATSPGPFRPPDMSSSSASEHDHSPNGGQSQSTSPGPSTISVYASGMEGLDGTLASTSRDPSTSPEHPTPTVPIPQQTTMTSRGTERKTIPTFREVPGYRPTPANRQTVSGPVPSGTASGSPSGPRATSGYLDPILRSTEVNRKGKGKAKEKTKKGKKYLALPSRDDEDDEEGEGYDLDDGDATSRGKFGGRGRLLPKSGLNEYEKALWKWVNVEDLDGFLQEVYAYYKGKGIYCIALARVLNLLTTFFVIAFSTFLLQCIDYTALTHVSSDPTSMGKLDEVLVPQCLTHGSVPHMLFIIVVSIFYVFQLFSFALSLPRLFEMYRFYTYLLGIPDADIQTLPWPEIVRLIGDIRKHNPVTSLSNGQAGALADMVGEDIKGETKKLDAHDVANRILRQENYLIALFNKDLLDLRVRLPIPRQYAHLVPQKLLATPNPSLPSTTVDRSPRQYVSFGANTLTKALEWNLRFCLLGYLFDRQGQVRKEFVRERKRKDLVEGLQRRLIFMGVLNAIFAPFIIVYLLIYSFFRYFEEYHKNPSSIGGRQYTPYAQWKFREFNELPHLFERRLDRSYPIAKEYIDQFPNEKSALVMRFVAFIAGSFAAVLLVASLLDPDLFLHFEITPHRTVLFYLGLFGSVLAIARGMIPQENLVFDPELSLREVVRWTHYLPGEWKGKLHSKMVHAEFSNLFALKIMIFFTELLSVLLTPFVLWFSLPPCAGVIIDFFREFTVHVDGVGYVCSFAVFDFRRHGNIKPPEPGAPVSPTTALSPQGAASANSSAKILSSGQEVTSPPTRGPGLGQGVGRRGREWRSNENKMEKSFLHFKATHPDWQPSDPASSIFLDRLVGMHQAALKADPSRSPFINAQSTYDSHGPQQSIHSPPGHGHGQGGPNPTAHQYGNEYHNGDGYGANFNVGHGQRDGSGSVLLGDNAGLRARSRSYDRAWAKSSHLLKTKPRLEAMRENAEPDDDVMREEDDVDPVGGSWNKRVGDSYKEEGEEDEEGFLKDVGMMGLLQQVMRR